MTKNYTKPSITRFEVKSETGILATSVTSYKIKVGTVDVEPYAAGFDEGGKDFKDYSFDE